jgi:zinc transport system substrate-binding protein
MRRQRFNRITLLALLLVSAVPLAVSCVSPTGEAPEKIGVVVTILPQSEFVKGVGGDRVEVTVMVPPGASPHTYAPTPGQLVAVKQAGMYAKVGSGGEFERVHMDRIEEAGRDMLVVDCSKGVELIEIVAHHHEGEESEHEGEHHHGGMDPHIWTSPLNAKTMVKNICDGLVEVDPENEDYYTQNRDEYLVKLDKLDADIRDGFSGVENRHFMVFHPAWGYFARDYGLTQISVEEEGKQPTAAGIAALVEQARTDDIRIVFVSPQFDAQSAKAIAEAIGGKVVPIDPLARDYIDNMGIILEKLTLAME